MSAICIPDCFPSYRLVVQTRHGWAKATKLLGRRTTHRLIGTHIDCHSGAMVEVDCEMEFVARNKTFSWLVTQVVR